MHKLNDVEQKKLDTIMDDFQEKIERLADRACARALHSLKKRFPKRRFRMDFYNGDSFFRVDEKHIRIMWNPSTRSVVWEPGTREGKIIPSSWTMEIGGAKVPPELFYELCILEDELIEITQGFSRGCPNKFDTENGNAE